MPIWRMVSIRGQIIPLSLTSARAVVETWVEAAPPKSRIPEYQRCGIGCSLVQCVVRSARQQKIRDVELTSWNFYFEAHKAFKQPGFSPTVVRFGVAV